MRSLLLKDYMVLSRQIVILLAVVLVFAVIPNEFLSSYAVVYATILPVSAAAYDEQSKWNVRAGMMPYSAFSIVFEKYVLGYISSACVTVITLAVCAVTGRLTAEKAVWLYALTLCALFLIALTLPLIFRFGVEKARLLAIILICCAAAFGGRAGAGVCSAFSNMRAVIVLFPVLVIAVQILSVWLSLRLYRASR